MGCCSSIQNEVVTSNIEPQRKPSRESSREPSREPKREPSREPESEADQKTKNALTLVEETTETKEKPMPDVRKTEQEENRPPGACF